LFYGDSNSSGEWVSTYRTQIMSAYANVSYFSAIGCRPPYENTNQQEVMNDRNGFVRSNTNRSIINF